MSAQLGKPDSAAYSIDDMPRMDAAMQTLAQRSMFWRPIYLAQSAWLEHIPFAFWLTEAHRPRVFVELGVHYGASYFAFCQAVDRLGLDTRCFGIDTFKGDEHAGAYDERVFEQVRSHNDLQYSGFSRLVRSTFDDALKHFANGSIDLLHIDGLHTLEAIRHDFEGWLPKLSSRAVVIMHDTNVRERNFGVFKLFEILRKKYPHFEFVHGHGLGVLGVGEEQSALMQTLFRASESEPSRQSVHEVFSRLGQACGAAYLIANQREQAKLLNGSIEKQKKQLDETRHSLEKAHAEIDSHAKELATAKKALENQLQQHAMEREHLVERAGLFQELRAELKEEVRQLQARLEVVSTESKMKDQELAALRREREESQRQIASVKAQLTARDRSIAQLHEQLNARAALEREQSDAMKRLSDEKSALLERLAARERALTDLQQAIEEGRKETAHTSRQLQDCRAERQAMQDYVARLESRNEELARENQTLIADKGRQAEDLEEMVKELADLNGVLKEKDAIVQAVSQETKAHQQRADTLSIELREKEDALTAAEKRLAETQVQAAAIQSQKDDLLAQVQAELQKLKKEQQTQEKRLEDRFKEIAVLTTMIEERDLSLKTKDKDVAMQQQRANKLDSELQARTEVLTATEKQLAEAKAKAAAIQAKKDEELARLQAEQQKLKSELLAKTEAIHANEKQLAEAKAKAAAIQVKKDEELARLQVEQQKLKNALQEKIETVKAGEKQLAETKSQAAAMQEKKDAELTRLHAEQQKLRSEQQAQAKRLEDRFKELATLTKLLEERDRALMAKNDELEAEKAHIERLLNPMKTQPSSPPKAQPEKLKSEKKEALSVKAQILLIEKSGLFDKSWYLTQYPDVAESRMNPVQHYVLHGASEGRMPGPHFDTNRYVANYPDVLKAQINPLVHYINQKMNQGHAAAHAGQGMNQERRP